MIVEATLEQMKSDFNWKEALDVAHFQKREVINNLDVPQGSFTYDNVMSVLASSEGYNDGDNWMALLLLKDGRFAYIDAWCDYTGWD